MENESLHDQVDRLATFIIRNFEGEPSQDQGAIDTAIRLLCSSPKYKNQWFPVDTARSAEYMGEKGSPAAEPARRMEMSGSAARRLPRENAETPASS